MSGNSIGFGKEIRILVFHIDSLVQNNCNSFPLVKDLQYFCTKPSKYAHYLGPRYSATRKIYPAHLLILL